MFRHFGTGDASSSGNPPPADEGPAAPIELRATEQPPIGGRSPGRTTQLSFQPDVERPTRRATLHRSHFRDPRCQPAEMKRRNEYWQSFDDPRRVLAFVDGIGERLHLCSWCRPVLKQIG